MSTIDYSVYRTPMIARQDGDSYTHEMDGCESEWLKSFDTLDEAVDYANTVEIDEPTIYHTKHGLDSVCYSEIEVCASEYDEDDNDWLPAECVYKVDGLPYGWKEAMMAYMVSYWRWLDYESSGRLTLEDCLEGSN